MPICAQKSKLFGRVANRAFHARSVRIPGNFQTLETSPIHTPDQQDEPKVKPSKTTTPSQGAATTI